MQSWPRARCAPVSSTGSHLAELTGSMRVQKIRHRHDPLGPRWGVAGADEVIAIFDEPSARSRRGSAASTTPMRSWAAAGSSEVSLLRPPSHEFVNVICCDVRRIQRAHSSPLSARPRPPASPCKHDVLNNISRSRLLARAWRWLVLAQRFNRRFYEARMGESCRSGLLTASARTPPARSTASRTLDNRPSIRLVRAR